MTTALPVSAAPATVAIRSEVLCRHYRMGETLIRAVDGVSLQVRAGEFVALLGSSGSGKSSVLNLVAGLDRPTSGSVVVQDRDLAKLSREELAKYRLHVVGMVFQSFNLIASMTLAENVELPLRFAEVDRSKRQSLSREALERVGLRARMNHRPSELSGGEQQRAALARALINRPRFCWPTNPPAISTATPALKSWTSSANSTEQLGMTVVMVTHERALAERYAQRMIFLADGKLVDDRQNAPTPGRRAVVKIPDLAELALRNLRESLLRNSLTTMGISVGVASLVAMLSLGIGLQQLISRRLMKSGLFDTVVVTSRRDLRGMGREEERNGPAPGESRILDDPRASRSNTCPTCSRLIPTFASSPNCATTTSHT
jgi:ABC-type lipoprotein export system ATPase subunit